MSEKRVALVTGSTAGIGAAVARKLADEGLRVVVNSARSVEAGRAFAAELPDAVYVQADISREDEANLLVQSALDAYGRLDVLVNNAGTTRRIPHADIAAATPEVWRAILDVNVLGTWQVTAAALPHLRRAGEEGERPASVVNISSVAGVRPAGSSIPYAVSKAAINHMTRLLAAAVAPGVRVNAVAPGLVETGWIEGFEDIRAMVEAKTPLRRVGKPEDVAAAVWALVSADYVTGEVLVTDGGGHLVIG